MDASAFTLHVLLQSRSPAAPRGACRWQWIALSGCLEFGFCRASPIACMCVSFLPQYNGVVTHKCPCLRGRNSPFMLILYDVPFKFKNLWTRSSAYYHMGTILMSSSWTAQCRCRLDEGCETIGKMGMGAQRKLMGRWLGGCNRS